MIPHLDRSLQHSLQSQILFSTQNSDSEMLPKSQEQLHIHPIRIPANEKSRNIYKTYNLPKRLNRINDHHPNLWCDQDSNDRQGRIKTVISCRYL